MAIKSDIMVMSFVTCKFFIWGLLGTIWGLQIQENM